MFVVAAAALTTVPAAAQTPLSSEASYVAVLRTLNPKLPVETARAYARSVMANAWRTHLDPRFIMSIVTVESRWRSNAVSRVGARGLGQLMPQTAANLGVDAWSPTDNLHGTSSYLKKLLDHFAGKKNAVTLAIAGYNAGPKAVERYHGVPPYSETQNYVVRVLRVWKTLNARIGNAFAPAPEAIAAKTPDERQWVTTSESALSPAVAAPALAPAAPAAPAAATAGAGAADAAGSGSVQPIK